VTACGPTVSPASGSAPMTGSTAGAKSSASSSATTTASVGHGFKISDGSSDEYEVYLTKVIDPARGSDSFNTPDKGNRFVGAVFSIKGVIGASSDDSNVDATLIGSNGQTYTADFDTIAGYTNFNSGTFNVSPGAVSIGAVTFQVPKGVKVNEVQWNADGGFGGATATWNVG
jgi:hypothetical protein